MRPRILLHRFVWIVLLSLGAASTLVATTPRVASQKANVKPPKVTVRSSGGILTAPARVVLTAELVGGPDDYADFYCPSVEWTWGDETTTKEQDDCDPYVAGKSEIRRRYTAEHAYSLSGVYTAVFRMLQHQKVVGSGSIGIRVDH